jgi:hypothetical protein
MKFSAHDSKRYFHFDSKNNISASQSVISEFRDSKYIYLTNIKDNEMMVIRNRGIK